jgi:hypothetical protein
MSGHTQVFGAVQLPPLPHVTVQTGVVQFASNHPLVHVQVSGALQMPPCSQVCTHCGVLQPAPP